MTDEECKPGVRVIWKNNPGVISSEGFRFGNGDMLYYIRHPKRKTFLGCATARELTQDKEAAK